MRPNLRRLSVEELIVHDLPKKLSRRVLRESPDVSSEEPVFSQVPSPVNEGIMNFFHDKITATIGSDAAFDVVFDPLSDTTIELLMNEYFLNNDNKTRIGITQQIAQHLYDIQNASNSSGLLLFVRCNDETQTVLSILKVEREEGVRVRQKTSVDGLMTFDVEHIRDLMLTRKTKLFKIVLFYLEDEIVKGIICDQQRGYYDKDIADFFLSDFLGCKLTEAPQILTKSFFENTQKYINERIESPEDKGALLNHLISEMTSHNSTLSPSAFALRSLPTDKRDEYIQFMCENGASTNNFSKQVNLIESKLKKIQYDFGSGIAVYGPKEAIDSKSTVTNLNNGEVKLEIVDLLMQVKAK